MSRPTERCETREQDIFRSQLDQIIDMMHELIRLASNHSTGAKPLGHRSRVETVKAGKSVYFTTLADLMPTGSSWTRWSFFGGQPRVSAKG